jgi:hypothetical protein
LAYWQKIAVNDVAAETNWMVMSEPEQTVAKTK